MPERKRFFPLIFSLILLIDISETLTWRGKDADYMFYDWNKTRAIISRVYKLEHVARNGLIAALSLIVALNNV